MKGHNRSTTNRESSTSTETPGMSADAPPPRTGLMKRLTTKLRPPAASSAPSQKRKASAQMQAGPVLPNSFTDAAHREAALRACGLIPATPHPYKDAHGYMVPLSEQEKLIDERRTVVVPTPGAQMKESEAQSEARRIKEEWLARNQEQDSDVPPPLPPKSHPPVLPF